MPTTKVALLTAGGLAPCLSSAVGGLIERYTALTPNAEILGYLGGYKGLLLGQSVLVSPEVRAQAGILHQHGGSPIGNSRVKLTNVADCVKRGLVKEGENPLHVAAERLRTDGITILHTIGGDDTNTTAAANAADQRLIKTMVDLAVECALRGESGVIGHDEERDNILRAIEFPRIRGGKTFDTATHWFDEMLKGIGQPRAQTVTAAR